MLGTFTIVMGILFFSCLPLGLIFLALGLFNRMPRRCTACGYDRHGLKAGAVCPECGASPNAMTGTEIPRVNWQVRLGAVLLCVSGVPLVLLIAVLIGRAV